MCSCIWQDAAEREIGTYRGTLVLKKYDNGNKYISLAYNANDPCIENHCGYIFTEPDNTNCLVASFEKYISLCPPNTKAF